LATIFKDATSLAWGSSGNELAIVDVQGRLWIYHSSPAAVNRLVLARQGSLDKQDDLLHPIGMMWLNQDRHDRPKNVILNTTKTDDRWQHAIVRARPLGPYWHRAVAIIHRNGLFTLSFQRRNGEYAQVSKELTLPDGVLYTHAAFMSTPENKLLIALHSYENSISVCLVSMDFTELGQIVEASPVLTVERIPSKVSSRPNGSPVSDLYDPDSWHISHLEILQPSDPEKLAHTPPTILAVLLGVNKTVNVTDAGYLVSSNLKRWTVTPKEIKLHPIFDALPSIGNAAAAPKFAYAIQEQSDRTEQVIAAIQHVDGVQTLGVTTLERSDFLSLDDFSPMSYAASEQESTCMSQSGFAFPHTQPIIHTGLSQNACVRSDIGADGKTHAIAIEYQLGQPQSLQPLDAQTDVAIASLNLTFSRVCQSNSAFDDVIMCASKTIPPELIPIVVSSMYRSMFRDTEFVHEKTPNSELEKVHARSNFFSKVMSYHASLTAYLPQLPSMASVGQRVGGWTLSAQWAWTLSNVRQVMLLLFTNLRDVQNVSIAVSADFTEMLCANLKWGLSLVRLIFDAILEVGDRETNPDFFDESDRGRYGDVNGDGRQGLVALLLNCHISRIFLIGFIRAVRTYAKIPTGKNDHQRRILDCIRQNTALKGLSFAAIESVFDYQWGAAGDVEGDVAATAVRQQEMMATGIVHESYQETVQSLLSKLFNSSSGLRAKNLIDRHKLFIEPTDLDYIFMNQDILGRKANDDSRPVVYDIHRKRLITHGTQLPTGVVGAAENPPMIRKCVRCGSFSSDVVVPPKDWPRQFQNLLTRCVCDGNWILVDWDEREK
jgi:hypothetical protein